MPKLFIGYKPGVGGVVKVMRNNADDPLATPNSAYGKFLFNSENSKTGYIDYFARYYRMGGLSDETRYFYPSGTNQSTCFKTVYKTSVSIQYQSVFPSRIIGRGNVPIVFERRPYSALGALTEGPTAYYARKQTQEYIIGENRSLGAYRMCLAKSTLGTSQDYSRPIIGKVSGNMKLNNDNSFSNQSFEDTPMLVTVMDLPADNSPMPSAPQGASGTQNTVITPTVVRIGKGGVAASGSNPDSLIIDSNKVPMKIARAGQVNVSAGSSTTVSSPVTLSGNVFLDYMAWEQGSPPYFPFPVTNTGGFVNDYRIKMQYRIYSNRVVIYNNGPTNIVVRYMVCFDDGQRSSGGTEVLRSLSSGDVQIKRPGSSDSSPQSKDILLDTRFAYPPIIREGYIGAGSFSGNTYTLNFPNDGSFYPFLKFYVSFDGGSRIQAPWARVFRTSPSTTWDGRHACDSCYARVDDNRVIFYMYRGNPSDLDNHDGGVRTRHNSYDRPDGYRYYLFAIPKNL